MFLKVYAVFDYSFHTPRNAKHFFYLGLRLRNNKFKIRKYGNLWTSLNIKPHPVILGINKCQAPSIWYNRQFIKSWTPQQRKPSLLLLLFVCFYFNCSREFQDTTHVKSQPISQKCRLRGLPATKEKWNNMNQLNIHSLQVAYLRVTPGIWTPWELYLLCLRIAQL